MTTLFSEDSRPGSWMPALDGRRGVAHNLFIQGDNPVRRLVPYHLIPRFLVRA